jgi:hypothetical protein
VLISLVKDKADYEEGHFVWACFFSSLAFVLWPLTFGSCFLAILAYIEFENLK